MHQTSASWKIFYSSRASRMTRDISFWFFSLIIKQESAESSDSRNLKEHSSNASSFNTIFVNYVMLDKLAKFPLVESNLCFLRVALFLHEIMDTRSFCALCDAWPSDRFARTFLSTFRMGKALRQSANVCVWLVHQIDWNAIRNRTTCTQMVSHPCADADEPSSEMPLHRPGKKNDFVWIFYLKWTTRQLIVAFVFWCTFCCIPTVVNYYDYYV